MQTMVPLYGFGGGGGTGAALTVTAPAGCTVTVSKDGKTKTKVAGADGTAVFKGLATGEWTLTINDGSQTASKPVMITANYSAAITFFSATIHISYPSGSTCTATDGVTTLTAPDTSGTWDCVVPNAGTWTVSLDGDAVRTFDITQNGETHTLRLQYLYHDGVYNTGVTGTWEAVGKNPNANYTSNAATPTISDGSSGFTITQNKPWCYGIYYGQTKVDLTNYSTLVATVSSCTINVGGNAYFRIWSSIGTYVVSNSVADQSITKVGKCTIDLSEITGDKIVGFATGNGEAKNGEPPTKVTIKRILCVGGV